MNKLIIVGHKNPDTDSIISAILAKDYFQALGYTAEAKRAGKINNETKFVLQLIGLDTPELIGVIGEGEKVVLVDHNETSQAFDQLEYTLVSHIIDHHKAIIKTENPIYCRMEPIGSTSSLLIKMFFEKNLDISTDQAKMAMAGILSDTLNLTSPTTTNEDRSLVAELNQIAKLDLENFVAEMFRAKSSLDGISLEEIIGIDYKNFEMGKNKVGFGVWETTFPDSVNSRKDEIIKALAMKKEMEKADYMYFMVVDILKQNSQLYIIEEREKELAEKVFGGKTEDGMLFLPGIVSRKKQIIPPLITELTK